MTTREQGKTVSWLQYVDGTGPCTRKDMCNHVINKIWRTGEIIGYQNGFWSGEYFIVACKDGTVQKVHPMDVTIQSDK